MARIIAIFVALFLVAVLATAPAFADVDAPASPVKVRYSTSPEKVRVVLDLPQEATITDKSTPMIPAVLINMPLAEALPVVTLTDPIVQGITVAPDIDGQMLLTLTLAKARKCAIFTLPAAGDKPFRVVVDVLKLFEKCEKRDLSPAITYSRIERQTEAKYLALHIVEINARDPHISFGVATAQGEREKVASMVTRNSAVCGVNGSYFLEGTRPVGLLKVEHQLLSLPLWGRTALAFPKKGLPIFGNPTGLWRVTLPDGCLRDLPDWLEGSVQQPTPTAVVLPGATYMRAPANPDGLTLLIRDGAVVQRGTTVMPLASGEYALLLKGDDARSLDTVLTDGAKVTFVPVVTPEWAQFPSAMGAGPRLLHKGRIENTGVIERFKPDILNGRPARTALGTTKDGRLILAVVEAPCPYGGGMTLDELAALMKSRGAVEAMNLDGGGSSCLAIGQDTVNYPPATWVRPVASGILVYDDRVKPEPPATLATNGTVTVGEKK
ncbi:MAG: phosphodiester glycosidase family protein [Armatimonadota bacterium]